MNHSNCTFLATVLHRICRVLFSECKVFFFGVILTIAVITEYHMSGWSEDGLPLPPLWISQSPLHLWSKIWVRFVACDSVRFGIDKVKLDPPLKVLNLPT